VYPWQAELLGLFEPMHDRLKVAAVTPNGAGKSSVVIAGLVLRWLVVHERGTVVVTSKDARQLRYQVWPSLVRHQKTFPDFRFLHGDLVVQNGAGGRAVLFTTHEGGRAEGWHGTPDAPLLVIVDEAKSVEEGIFEAFDRCTYQALFYVSSPGLTRGRFWEAFQKASHGFVTRRISLKECPHIPPARCADIEARYGVDHPFTRSTLHGEFVDADGAETPVMTRALLREAAARRWSAELGAERFAFCDFAAGGDENVLAVCYGRLLETLVAWREANTMAAVRRFVAEFHRLQLVPGRIGADAGGLGMAMCDALAEAGWPVIRVNAGGSPGNPRYVNRGAELWHEFAAGLRRGEIALPELDSVLLEQLASRRVTLPLDGKLGVEPKAALRARGGESPDRADAVVGAFGWIFWAVPQGWRSAEMPPLPVWSEPDGIYGAG
jgi:hypothetical protein